MKWSLLLMLILYGFFAGAQEHAPVVKWATQETFFEDLAGKPLPDFTGLTVYGRPFTAKELKGQVVVINFWFEKCPPCVAEMPELNELYKRYSGKNVRFIGITPDRPHPARKFQQKSGYRYDILCLSQEEIRKLNINHGFPSNILVGADGKILYATAKLSFTDPDLKAKAIAFEQALAGALSANP